MPEEKKSGKNKGKNQKKEDSPSLDEETRQESSSVPKRKKFYIVGIGASAGGLESLEQFFSKLPEKSRMAFVLIQHLEPHHKSILPELIQKSASIKVIQVEDGVKVKPNTAYVIPPNKYLSIHDGALRLTEFSAERTSRLPVDHFFNSLAEDQGEKAIGIIFSGMGTDGTKGFKSIKNESGMTMAQDPLSAKYDSMPRSAIDAGYVDYIMPPEEMPEQLLSYVDPHLITSPEIIESEREKSPDSLRKIFALLQLKTGHDLSSYKHSTIYRRIDRRMNIHQIEKISQYIRYLHQNPDEVNSLFKELLIGVTSFFRDPEAFEVLKNEVFPRYFENNKTGNVRIWVPGCSSGEEAYSMAIILREFMNDYGQNFSVQIFATDIDEEAINIARPGVYSNNISADIDEVRLRRYFIKKENLFQVRKEIREMLVFAPQDIIKDPPFTKLDILSCRNLLIYLNSDLQKKLLPLFHYSLKPRSILLLGSSETIGNYTDLFKTIDKKWKIFERRETPLNRTQVEFPINSRRYDDAGVREEKRGGAPTNQLAERILLNSFTPPSVIINEGGEILYFHGKTGKYLEHPQGEARLNIFEMAHGRLKLELTTAIRKAITEKKAIEYDNLLLKGSNEPLTIKLWVKPVQTHRLLVVSFEEKTDQKKGKAPKEKKKIAQRDNEEVEALKKELSNTRENLQSTIEELETSNEELKSLNEELQSTNEELHSSNEELETSREELQSLNEELVTINAEYQGKNEELGKANNDMKNLFDSMEIATIFLDNELRIKSFTSDASKIINLIASDVGRPIQHIVTNLKYDRVVEDATRVMKKLTAFEEEVETKKGHWYLMRILPYRTLENAIGGIIITFIDVHAQKTLAQEMERLSIEAIKARTYSDGIIDTLRESLLVLDEKLRVVSANRSFYKTFGVTTAQTENRLIFELGSSELDIPSLRRLLNEVLKQNKVFNDYQFEHEFPGIGYRKLVLNARRIVYEKAPHDSTQILLAIDDVTER